MREAGEGKAGEARGEEKKALNRESGTVRKAVADIN